MAAYEIRADRARNRVYFRPPPEICPDGAHHDEGGWWYGRADVPPGGIAACLDHLVAEQDEITASAAIYAQARAQVPAGYRRRDGALHGGVVRFDGEVVAREYPPAFGLLRSATEWAPLARHVLARGHVGLVAGKVMDEDILSIAHCTDGRPVFREVQLRGFGDDQRETYWLPPDLWSAICAAEVKARGITSSQARDWLTAYRGCVGTELYEYASEYAAGEEAQHARISQPPQPPQP